MKPSELEVSENQVDSEGKPYSLFDNVPDSTTDPLRVLLRIEAEAHGYTDVCLYLNAK